MKHILLVVCGGVAAYKAAELTRLLRRGGARVRVVMTEHAQKFVAPLLFQALSGEAVHTQLLDAGQESAMGHIELARWADAVIVAPATANFMAKLAGGLADDLAGALLLAAECPVFAAPAMNQAMWRHAATQENAAILRRRGVELIGPEAGEQACGETGFGRMSEPEAICRRLLEAWPPALAGLRVVVSAGPTREPLDPVRFLSNRSSGKMGYALAEAARRLGAEVDLVSGPVALPPPHGVRLTRVETAAEMAAAVLPLAARADIYIGAAAVADYRPAEPNARKMKKSAEGAVLNLVPNPDILAAVAALPEKPFTLGFAAETDDLERYALGKLAAKKLDMIAANWVGRAEGGFDSDENALHVFWPGGDQFLELGSKAELARRLLLLVAERFTGCSMGPPAR